jgi:hypothetical protein
MTTDALLVYTAPNYFGTTAQLDAAMASAPIPDIGFLGLLLKSDVTAGGVRTMHFGLVPTVTATAIASLVPGNRGAPIDFLTLTAKGLGYTTPPEVLITGGVGSEPLIQSAAGIALMQVNTIPVSSSGSGYTAPVVTLVGGLAQGGAAATAVANLFGGAILSILVKTSGSGYTSVPEVVITDPTGTGAVATAVMEIGELVLTRAGRGYETAPTVTLVPRFKQYFPDGTNQAYPLFNLMTESIQKTALVQVTAAPPVIT